MLTHLTHRIGNGFGLWDQWGLDETMQRWKNSRHSPFIQIVLGIKCFNFYVLYATKCTFLVKYRGILSKEKRPMYKAGLWQACHSWAAWLEGGPCSWGVGGHDPFALLARIPFPYNIRPNRPTEGLLGPHSFILCRCLPSWQPGQRISCLFSWQPGQRISCLFSWQPGLKYQLFLYIYN